MELEKDCKELVMEKHKCDLCGKPIGFDDDGVSFNGYWIRVDCVHQFRRAVCIRCAGTGKRRVVDDQATFAQGTCGENRA